MRLRTSFFIFVTALIGAGSVRGETIWFSTAGTGSMHYPGPVTPPSAAPWGTNGYPGDTVELLGLTGSLDLIAGSSQILKINTVKWTIDYTYAGTATDPEAWTDLTFNILAVQSMQLGAASGNLHQNGTLRASWDNDYLSFLNGATSTFVAGNYQVKVTPLGLTEVGGSFSGGNPWVQPTRDLYAQFDVTTAVPLPGIVYLGLTLLGGVAGTRFLRRRPHAA